MQAEVMQDLSTLIEKGGYVMVPLLILSIISVALILERCWFWLLMGGRGSMRRIEKLNAVLRRGDTAKAQEIVKRDYSPYGIVAKAMLENGSSDAVAMEAVELQRPRIDRFMVALSTIITAAPHLVKITRRKS